MRYETMLGHSALYLLRVNLKRSAIDVLRSAQDHVRQCLLDDIINELQTGSFFLAMKNSRSCSSALRILAYAEAEVAIELIRDSENNVEYEVAAMARPSETEKLLRLLHAVESITSRHRGIHQVTNVPVKNDKSTT